MEQAFQPLVPTDPKAALLAKLQGGWEVDVESDDLPKGKKPNFRVIAEIRDNVMTWSLAPPQPENDKPPVFLIKLGEPGTPQPVDLIANPNDGDQRAELPGIMEVSQDVIRICVNTNSDGQRPEVLVAGKAADLYVLRRRETAPPVTELEGDWHLVSSRDEEGERRDVPPTNRTFRGDRSTVVWSGGGHECRIKVNPEAKTIWYYSKEEDNSFTMDHYEWKGDQLILRDSPGDEEYEVFERGHVRIPKVVPPATKEQETRWRSGIVEIMIGGELAGRGVVVSPKGLILCQLTGGYRNGSIIAAKFDDGSQVELTGVEGGEDDEQRLFALQPKDEIRVDVDPERARALGITPDDVAKHFKNHFY